VGPEGLGKFKNSLRWVSNPQLSGLYNENIASFNVFNMPVILILDIGLFSSSMQGAI
jgi:hypothetical protein